MRAFGTLLQSCFDYYENKGAFDKFIGFCVSNQIPNNRDSAEYTFLRPYKLAAAELGVYLVLFIVFILVASLSKSSRLIWLILFMPIFLICMRSLLLFNYISLKLWWYGRRERMILCPNPLENIGHPPVTIASDYEIILDRRILKAQNRRMALFALIAISVSLLISVVLTVVTS